MSRRKFLKSATRLLLGTAAVGLGGLAYASQIEPGWVQLTRLTLKLPRLASAFHDMRLVHLSDIHMGGWMTRAHLDEVAQTVLALKPDVVAITGDYLTGYEFGEVQVNALADVSAALQPISASCCTVGCLGNHDYWTNDYFVRLMLRQTNITELSNSFITLTRGSDQLHLAGVDDIREGRDRLDLVLEKLPAQGCAILLAHEPDFADTSSASGRFDLQLSGHSHGGQVVLPLIGPLILPHFARRYPSGLYQVGSMYQYTSRGLGMASLPVRFNCRPEITEITLETL